MAHEIFKLFREADRKKYESIVIEGLFEDGIGSAVMDRIKRASDETI
jgi:hypothetical protein